MNSKILIILCLLIAVMSLTAAGAAEVDDGVDEAPTGEVNQLASQIDVDELSADDSDVKADAATENVLKSTDEDAPVGSGPDENFTALQTLINKSGDEVNLNCNYTFADNEILDNGAVFIDKNLTINGNGNTIDADTKSGIFYLSDECKSLTLNNMTLKGAYGDYSVLFRSSAEGFTLTLNDVTFLENYAKDGIISLDAGTGSLKAVWTDVSFISNTVESGTVLRIYADYVNLTCADVTFVHNEIVIGTDNHIVRIEGKSGINMTCRNVNLTDNSGEDNIVKITSDAGSIDMKCANVFFGNNSAESDILLIKSLANLNVDCGDVNFTGNTADGGKIVYIETAEGSIDLSFNDVVFSKNNCSDIYVYIDSGAADSVFTNLTIVCGNVDFSNENSSSGLIYLNSYGNIDMDCIGIVISNSTSEMGDFVYIYSDHGHANLTLGNVDFEKVNVAYDVVSIKADRDVGVSLGDVCMVNVTSNELNLFEIISNIGGVNLAGANFTILNSTSINGMAVYISSYNNVNLTLGNVEFKNVKAEEYIVSIYADGDVGMSLGDASIVNVTSNNQDIFEIISNTGGVNLTGANANLSVVHADNYILYVYGMDYVSAEFGDVDIVNASTNYADIISVSSDYDVGITCGDISIVSTDSDIGSIVSISSDDGFVIVNSGNVVLKENRVDEGYIVSIYSTLEDVNFTGANVRFDKNYAFDGILSIKSYSQVNLIFDEAEFIKNDGMQGYVADIAGNNSVNVDCEAMRFINNSGPFISIAYLNNNGHDHGSVIVECAKEMSFIGNEALNYTAIIMSNFINMSCAKGSVINNTVHDPSGEIFYITDRSNQGSEIYVLLENTDFINNTGSSLGGAICIFSNGTVLNVTIVGGSFVNNNATRYGGAIFVDKMSSNGANINIVNTAFENNAAHNGGAIFVDCKNTTSDLYFDITGSTFKNNTACYGGAISMLCANVTLRCEDTDFIKNALVPGSPSTPDGGALYLNVTSVKASFNNVSFIKNSANDMGLLGYGGAIRIISLSDFENSINFTDSRFINNTGHYGGAISTDSVSIIDMHFNNTNLTGNAAYLTGGAISIERVAQLNLHFNNANLEDNRAVGAAGAVYIYSHSTAACNVYLRTIDTKFKNNSAPWSGALDITAGINSFNFVLNGTGTEFIDNKANYAGAVNFECSNAEIINVTFKNNTASYGGAIFNWGNLTVTNALFVNNTAEQGGAIYNWENLTVVNSVFLDNKANSTELNVTNQTNILNITLTGEEHYLNAIYSENDRVTFKNVTYWNGNVVNTDDIADNTYTNESGQNITVEVYSGTVRKSVSQLTSADGHLSLDFSGYRLPSGEYTYRAYHPDDRYYTYIEKTGTFKILTVKLNTTLTVSVENITYGENATVRITLKDADGNNITGVSVNVTVAGQPYEITVTDGVGSRNITGLWANDNYIVNATFNGTEDYNSSNATANFTVFRANSTIIIKIENVTYNATVKINATVVPAGDVICTLMYADGTVIDANFVVDLNTLTFNLGAGNYTLVVNTVQSQNYNATQAKVNFTVYKANSTLTANNITFDYGGSNFTAVDYEGATNVTAYVIGHSEATVTVGNKVVTVSGLDASNYTLNITTNPDGNHTAVTKLVNVTVNKITSSVTIVPIVNVTYNASTAFNFTVVNVTDVNWTIVDRVTGKSVYEDSGLANFTLALGAGNYTFRVVNNDTANIAGSSDSCDFSVNRATSSVSIVPFVNVTFGTETAFNFTVINATNVTWTIVDRLTDKLVRNGSDLANFTWALGAGNYTFRVVNNDTVNVAGSSDFAFFTVNMAHSAVNITELNNVTYNATVFVRYSVENRTEVTYTVTYANGTEIGINNVPVGSVSVNQIILEHLAAGNYTITIYNAGNQNYTKSSFAANFTVYKAPSAVDITELNNVTYNATVIVRYSVENRTNVTYTVTYADGTKININDVPVTDLAKIELVNLAAGNYTITIFNAENQNFTRSSITANFTVYKATSRVNVTTANVTYNEDVIVNVTVLNKTTVKYNVTTKDGQTIVPTKVWEANSIVLSDLAAGDYTITIENVDTANITGYIASANFTVYQATTSVNLTDQNVTYPEYVFVNVTVVNATEIWYVLTKEGESSGIVVDATVNGMITLKFDLGAGNYILNVTTNPDSNHTKASNWARITVNPAPSSVSGKDVNVTYGEPIVVQITSENATNVTYKVINSSGDVFAEGTVAPGKNITGLQLPVGNYVVNLTTVTDRNHTQVSNTSKITVNRISDFDVNVSSTTTSPGENAIVTVDVPQNATGNVTVTLANGTNYTGEIKNGHATVIIPNLPAGDNKVTVTYSGDGNYTSKTVNASIHVKEIIIDANDMKRGWASPYDYMAKITYEGTPAADMEVIFEISGKNYTAKTDSEGIAKLTDSKLDVGKYSVTVILKATGANATKNLEIVARIIENTDLTMDYKDGHKFTVRAIGDDGNPVGEGVVVSIKINGKTYQLKTDKNGYARLPINLIPKKYTATSTYHSYAVKNKVTVKQILKLVKKTVTVKKGKKIILKAKLKWTNGKPIKGKLIKFKFRGKTFNAKTNKKGIAKVTVKNKKILNKLKKGKKYTYSARYIKDIVKGKVNVKK